MLYPDLYVKYDHVSKHADEYGTQFPSKYISLVVFTASDANIWMLLPEQSKVHTKIFWSTISKCVHVRKADVHHEIPSHFVNSHFFNSHFVNSYFVNFPFCQCWQSENWQNGNRSSRLKKKLMDLNVMLSIWSRMVKTQQILYIATYR